MDRIERLKRGRTENQLKYQPNGVLIKASNKKTNRSFNKNIIINNNIPIFKNNAKFNKNLPILYDVVLVGNGPSVLKTKMGKEIDKFKTVIRFNVFDIDEEFTGTKCNVWVLNGKCIIDKFKKFKAILTRAREYKEKYGDIDKFVFKVNKSTVSNRISELRKIFPNAKFEMMLNNTPSLRNDLVTSVGMEMKKPTTGLYTIFWARIHYNCPIPTIYGYDMINGVGGHYNKDKYIDAHPLDEEQEALRTMLNKKIINLFNINTNDNILDFIKSPKTILVTKDNAEHNGIEKSLVPDLPDILKDTKNKSVAVVGNSYSLLNSNYGKEIDSHDIIIRFNFGLTKGYESDVGSRTDLRILGKNHIFREFKNELMIHRYNKDVYKNADKIVHLKECYPNLTGFTDEYYNFINNEFFCGSICSSGFMGVAMALKLFENVSVYGFQNTNEKQHYYPDPEIAKGTIFNISERHQVNKERGICLQFLKENYIKIRMGE